MTSMPSLTTERVRGCEAHWRKRQWIVLVGTLGLLVAGLGVFSYVRQWVANDRLGEGGIRVPATIYQSDYGRNSKIHVEHTFEGRRYRNEIDPGFFTRTNTTRGDSVVVIIDPEDPGFARTPDLRNISTTARMLLCATPFAFLALWLGYGALHIRGRIKDAIWFRGTFEIKRRSASSLHAQLWDENGAGLHSSQRMQGTVRSGRPLMGCYFALLGRFVMVIQDDDRDGVLVPHKGNLSTDGLTAVAVRDAPVDDWPRQSKT